MTAELLPYYNRELSFIRRLAAEFAAEHPKIAGRLRLGPSGSGEDPHVERLIEAFAFLSARIRHKLDDEFPEITEALLGVLYPQYQAPIPSMAIVQFELDPNQSKLTTGHTIPRHTQIDTDPIEGEPCHFRTCYPVTLWPIDVKMATLAKPPFRAPVTRRASQASAVLRLVLRCRADALRFADLALSSLRFFLKGQPQHVFHLYELILNNTVEVALAESPEDPAPVVLDPPCLQTAGFEREDGMLPYSARSFLGYRLLWDYFAFPQKFLFFDFAGLDRQVLGRFGPKLEIYFYLNQRAPDLEQNVSADTFALGCTPVVNLYRQRAEPIQLNQTDYEYRVVPDARRPLANEIYSIDRVTASSPDGSQQEFRPFFSTKHAGETNGAPQTFWHATRRSAEQTEDQNDHGTEVFLSLVDLGFIPTALADWTVDVETTCLNRDLPHQLPFGGDQPHLQLSEGGALVSRILCLTPPTRTLRPALKQGVLWRLISHLSLNHLSLVDNDDKAEALREILKLYDFADSPETRKLIDGILRVTSRRVVGRADNTFPGAFCRGVEVTIHFDEEHFSGSGLFLFASILERFLALYCTVNSFSQLIATTKGREGELRRWHPRMGEKVLL
jgi:type VI secretion system protein ImpG